MTFVTLSGLMWTLRDCGDCGYITILWRHYETVWRHSGDLSSEFNSASSEDGVRVGGNGGRAGLGRCTDITQAAGVARELFSFLCRSASCLSIHSAAEAYSEANCPLRRDTSRWHLPSSLLTPLRLQRESCGLRVKVRMKSDPSAHFDETLGLNYESVQSGGVRSKLSRIGQPSKARPDPSRLRSKYEELQRLLASRPHTAHAPPRRQAPRCTPGPSTHTVPLASTTPRSHTPGPRRPPTPPTCTIPVPAHPSICRASTTTVRGWISSTTSGGGKVIIVPEFRLWRLELSPR